MKIINTLTILLFYQLVGEVAVRFFAWSIPGPVLGMLLLFLTLLGRGESKEYGELATQVSGFLMHLSLLFIPAGVGIMSYSDRIADEWKTIVITLVCSALLTLIGSAVIMKIVSRLCTTQNSWRGKDNG